MSKSSFDRRIREAAIPLLETDEDIEAVLVAQMGIGMWVPLLAAGAVAFLINISLPDSLGRSIASACVFGLAVFIWVLVAPAHGIVLTDRRVLFFQMTLGNRVKGPAFDSPRSGITTREPLSGRGGQKLILHRTAQAPIRLNIAWPWRGEAEALNRALHEETDSPPSEAAG